MNEIFYIHSQLYLNKTMIIIFSSYSGDLTTDQVVDWLYDYEEKFIRITPISIAFENQIRIENSKTFINNYELNANSNIAFWYRRWSPSNEITGYFKNKNKQNHLTKKIINLIISETDNIGNYIFNHFANFKWLSKPIDEKINKLFQAEVARKVGLKVPETYLTSEREIIKKLIKNSMVTKLINSPFSIINNYNIFYSYTTEIDEIKEEIIFPSLIQEKINKQFEIRTFYLDGEMYSAAIFSQQDSQTNIDYRKYNYKNPNRVVPFEIDKDTKKKVNYLMNELKMNTGSIDFIYSEEGDIIFLEVNPVGQFGSISKQCNYYLEKRIASYLKNYEK